MSATDPEARAEDVHAPPVSKYRLTITIRGNSHEEIEEELGYMVRGGYLLASDYRSRDQFDVIGGRDRMTLEHTNPDMTPERYMDELHSWSDRRRVERRAAQTTHPTPDVGHETGSEG